MLDLSQKYSGEDLVKEFLPETEKRNEGVATTKEERRNNERQSKGNS